MRRAVNLFSVLLGLAIFCLTMTPEAFVALCRTRRLSMPEINGEGIRCVVLYSSFALVLLLAALIPGRRIRRWSHTGAALSQRQFEICSRQKSRRFSRTICEIILSLLPLLSIAEPVIRLTVVRNLDSTIIEAYYLWLFIAVGLFLGCFAGALIRALCWRRISFYADESIRDVPGKSWKKAAVAFACILAIFSVTVAMMRSNNWFIQPYVSTIPSVSHREHAISYAEDTGVYTIRNCESGDFRLLMLTDIHLGGSIVSRQKDLKALKAVYELIERTHPDLVVITGDLVFPLGLFSFSLNNYAPIMQFASFMRNIGIPWAVTFGNHDTERVATHTDDEIGEMVRQFSFVQSGSPLLFPASQPDITGRSNQVICIENQDGSLCQALFLLDSNSYISGKLNDYDYIHDDQVEWYADMIERLNRQYGQDAPSMIFTHMPLREYQTAYALYKAGSDQVTYHFGKVREDIEQVSCSEHESSLFETAHRLGSTTAIFCGHDHYHNISMTYRGIRLTYGMSIDYLAMPGIADQTEQRGGTIITLHPGGDYGIEQVPLRK